MSLGCINCKWHVKTFVNMGRPCSVKGLLMEAGRRKMVNRAQVGLAKVRISDTTKSFQKEQLMYKGQGERCRTCYGSFYAF